MDNSLLPRAGSETSQSAVIGTRGAENATAGLYELEPRVNLREAFPISFRLVFIESLGSTLLLITTVFLYVVLRLHGPQEHTFFGSGFECFLTRFYYIGVFLCSAKIIYELLCYLFWRYAIQLDHLTISRGLLFRSNSSFPISKINDVSLHRTPLQILFGLYTMTILTASPTSTYGSIQGLNSKSAFGLQAYLLALVETTLPTSKQGVAEARLFANSQSAENLVNPSQQQTPGGT